MSELPEDGVEVAKFSFRQSGKPRGEVSDIWGNSNCCVVMEKHFPLPSGTILGGKIYWHSVPKDILPTDPDKKRLARIFSEFPNRSFLQKAKDSCQIEKWVVTKTESLFVAQCLLAGTEYPDNPLLSSLESGEIDKFRHDFLWLLAGYYNNLWELLTVKHKKICDALKKKGWQPPLSALNLLGEIARGNVEGEFENIFKSHYVFSEVDLRRIGEFGRSYCDGKLEEAKRPKFCTLLKKHANPSIWLDRLLEVCQELAKKDHLIHAALQKHYVICRAIYSKLDDSTRKPKISHHGKSYTVLNGRIFSGVNRFE